ncbi:MAG: hypothetical protein IPI43_28295 [Sandaracinaceae bacterium]|nr:hypothetical protein [Sandaracinaceae bacterium]
MTLCTANTDCDDGVFCNGAERCMPSSTAAGADGCVVGVAPCIANMTCDEAADTCGTACTDGDMDGDGHDAVACGGDDCDDTDADRFPGNPETCDDGARAGSTTRIATPPRSALRTATATARWLQLLQHGHQRTELRHGL